VTAQNCLGGDSFNGFTSFFIGLPVGAGKECDPRYMRPLFCFVSLQIVPSSGERVFASDGFVTVF